MPHNKKAIREVLNGDVAELSAALIWRNSPQGVTHWVDIAFGYKKLSKRSRQYLNKLLNS